MEIGSKLRWLLAQLKPNCTSMASRNLSRQGFDCFAPLERHTQKQKGRFRPMTRPYFPGYIFVGTRAEDSPWRAIRSTRGVARLVGFGPEPATVPTEIVEELMLCCDLDGCVTTLSQISVGEQVQVNHGPLTNFVGRVEKLAPDQRAWVLIDIMGRSTRSSIPRSNLTLASPSTRQQQL